MEPPGRNVVDLHNATIIIRTENWEWTQHLLGRYGEALILIAAVQQGAEVIVQDRQRTTRHRQVGTGAKHAPRAIG